MTRHYVEDIAGQVYGKLTVLSYQGMRKTVGQMWEVKCACGTVKTIAKGSMVSGNVKSCGCQRREMARVAAKKVRPDQSGEPFRKEESLPDIGIEFAKRAWFVFDGDAHQVSSCLDRIIYLAVIAAIRGRKEANDVLEVLGEVPYDLYTRWWLLLELNKMKRGIVLYSCREQAETALKEKEDINTKAS